MFVLQAFVCRAYRLVIFGALSTIFPVIGMIAHERNFTFFQGNYSCYDTKLKIYNLESY